jgi:hypothetical protein
MRIVPNAENAVYVWTSAVDNASTDQTFMRPLAIR